VLGHLNVEHVADECRGSNFDDHSCSETGRARWNSAAIGHPAQVLNWLLRCAQLALVRRRGRKLGHVGESAGVKPGRRGSAPSTSGALTEAVGNDGNPDFSVWDGQTGEM
jgi:hypothetical protein